MRPPLSPNPTPKGLSLIRGIIFSLLIPLTLKEASSLLKAERILRMMELLLPILVWVRNKIMTINIPPAMNRFLKLRHSTAYAHNPTKGTAMALRVPEVNNRR